MAARQGERLDEELILRELRPLLELKRSPEVEEQLRQVLARGRA